MVAESRTPDGIQVRFTQKKNVLYIILLGTPVGRDIVIENFRPGSISNVKYLGRDIVHEWRQQGAALLIHLDDELEPSPAYAFGINLN